MPSSTDLIRTLEDLGMPLQDVNMWWQYLELTNSAIQNIPSDGDLVVETLTTKYGQPMFKAAETKIGNAGQQVSAFTWTVPSDGSHLEIRVSCASERSADVSVLGMRFNGDTGSNYERQFDIGLGSVPTSANSGNQTHIPVFSPVGDDADANSASPCVIFINNYNNSTLHTGVNIIAGRPDGSAPTSSLSGTIHGWWKNTAAIRTITLFDVNDEKWVVGSNFSLYVLP